MQKTIQIFRQNLHDDLAAQFSVCLFLGICRCDITAVFVCKRGDLLDSIIKADDLEFDSRVADQFAIGQLWSRRFAGFGSSFFSDSESFDPGTIVRSRLSDAFGVLSLASTEEAGGGAWSDHGLWSRRGEFVRFI